MSIHDFDALNRLTSGLMMKINQNNIDDSKEIINGPKAINQSKNSENLNYFYPSIHSIEHQIRWFKGSRDRCLQYDKAV